MATIDGHLEALNDIVKDKFQEAGNIKDKSGPDRIKDGQARDGGEDIIAYLDIEGFQVNDKRS